MEQTTSESATARLLNWKPSDAQRIHGYQVYASRVFKEALAFEKAGVMDQANMRYEKTKAYCSLRGISYPPFSQAEINIIKDRVLHPSEFPKLSDRPTNMKKQKKAAKRSRKATAPDDPRIVHGQLIYAARECAAGRWDIAKAYCEKKGLRWPPFDHITVPASGCVHGSPGEPASPQCVTLEEGHETHDPEARVAPVVAPVVAPKPVKLEDLPLREQLRRQLAEIDKQERLEAAKAAFAASPQSYADVMTLANTLKVLEAQPAVTEEAPVAPVPAPVEHVSKPAPAPEPQKAPEPAKAPEAPLPEGQRWAVVNNFCINPRVANIRFLDGKGELGSMWLTRTGVRVHDKLIVRLERGTPELNAMYQEVRPRI